MTGPSDLLAEAAELGSALAAVRADLHRHPELSWQEHRTTAEVAARLEALGLEPVRFDDTTGLTADVELGDGPVVALRADLDALPLDDHTKGEHRSTVDGVSHACGHDVHTTALLGAAELLARRRGTGGGTVRLVFQPAEEAIPGGARRVLASRRLADVHSIHALHCDPSLPVGTVGVRAGAITSAADRLRLHLWGRGGHTARPHLTHDLVRLVAQVAVTVPDRVAGPPGADEGLSIVFGHVAAGHAPNVIPSEALLEGTLRTRSKAAWDGAPDALHKEVASLLDDTGVGWDLTHERGNPPVVNDPVVTEVARQALGALLGGDRVVEAHQSAGSEDFSWYLEEVPGTYVRLGVAGPDGPGCDLHRSDFDVADGSVVHGAAALTAMALGALAAASA